MKVIQSSQNQTYKDWKKLLRRKGREKAGIYLLEGPHLVTGALKEPDMVKAIIFDEDFDQQDSFSDRNCPSYQLNKTLFSELSSTETPQGVMAVCAIIERAPSDKGKRFLLIDAVQDPGNLGTIIRTADAAGMDAVYLGTGTVDLYNEKVLRSAQGSHFHIPIIQDALPNVIAELKAKEIPIVGTSLQGNNLGETTMTHGKGFALLVGNEGEGVNKELLKMTDINVKIPIYGQAESLNVAVATGILMYYLRGF
jgi:RNA methyltransferase, TrmH family